ncbi:MAG: hypothetical protein EAZ97_10425 [Bacteroidetes bacterium]|nr:MAG: hypothetical protein EAZ97_10425 [Bacteroidota bacterium]
MNQVINFKWIGIYILLFLLISCVPDIISVENSINDKNFNIIYDNNTFENFEALDIKSTSDSGYIILGRYSNTSEDFRIQNISYLLKVDAKGVFQWDTRQDKAFHAYREPVGELIVKGENYYFVCEKNFSTTFVELNGRTKKITDRTKFDLITRVERCVATKDGGYLLLGGSSCLPSVGGGTSKNPSANISLYKVNANYEIVWDRCFAKTPQYGIVQPDIERYYNCGEFFDKGKSYTFCHAYYNDFYQPLFLDSLGKFLFEVEDSSYRFPYQINQIKEGLFFATFTDFRDIYFTQGFNILPENKKATFNKPNIFHEIDPTQKIFGIPAFIKGKDVFICGVGLRESIIGIYIINPKKEGGVLLGSTIIGNSRVYEYKSLCRSQDGGIMILATTYVGNRFARIGIFKITKNNLESLVPN